jgi:hypothetical protein
MGSAQAFEPCYCVTFASGDIHQDAVALRCDAGVATLRFLPACSGDKLKLKIQYSNSCNFAFLGLHSPALGPWAASLSVQVTSSGEV